jgi:hypothetical protein
LFSSNLPCRFRESPGIPTVILDTSGTAFATCCKFIT